MGENDMITQFALALQEPVHLPEQYIVVEGDDASKSGFTDDHVPSGHQKVVEDATQVIHTCMENIAQNIFEVGRQLARVKKVLEHGRFHQWAIAEFGFNERKAQRFMNVYRRFGKKAHIFGKLKPTALYHLAAPSVPTKAITIVEKMVRAGKCLSVQDVVDIIEACKRRALPKNEELGTASRLAVALQRAGACLSSQAVTDCEWVLGEDYANSLEGIRSDLKSLLSLVRARTQRVERSSATVGASEWPVVRDYVQPTPVQPQFDNDLVLQPANSQWDQTLDGSPHADDTIYPGCTVHIHLGDSDEEEHYTIVADEQSDPEHSCINVKSPVAQALIGKQVGEIAVAHTPSGDIRLAITGIQLPENHAHGRI